MNNTTYTRRDVTSIYEYLKEQAAELSNGRWTDFSSGDIGSILLGLMAFLADQTNFQLDKTASELFLDTALERSTIMAMLKLVGYEPRHYEAARVTIEISSTNTNDNIIIPAYTTFTNSDGTITYQNLYPIIISNGKGISTEVYEGTRVQATYQYSDITSDGKLYLPDYKIGTNTVQLYIPSISSSLIPKVPNVKFTDGEFVFSVHVNEEALVYIQLPSFWADMLTTNATLRVNYLLTNGEAGRIGAGIINRFAQTSYSVTQFTVTNPSQSVGGFFPETVDEIKISAPIHVRTMDTIVTKKDLNELAGKTKETALIAQIKAGDYNDTWTGFTQPDDAYKCKVLVVPFNRNETSIYAQDSNLYFKYTGIIKGDNEFDPTWVDTSTINGITTSIYNDHLVIDGTALADIEIPINIPAGQFTNNNVYLYLKADENIGSINFGTDIQITNNWTKNAINLYNITYGTIKISGGSSFTNCKIYIDIRNTDIDLADYLYEPYTDGEEVTAIYWYDKTNNILYDSMYEISTVPLNTLKLQYSDSTKELMNYIDERRLASLMFIYEDPGRVVPNIRLNIYTDPNDLRTKTIASQVKQFMQENYYRDKLGIGEDLPGSVIGKDLLNRFEVINYIEVVEPDINITCGENEYIDMYYAKFKIYVNDELSSINEY